MMPEKILVIVWSMDWSLVCQDDDVTSVFNDFLEDFAILFDVDVVPAFYPCFHSNLSRQRHGRMDWGVSQLLKIYMNFVIIYHPSIFLQNLTDKVDLVHKKNLPLLLIEFYNSFLDLKNY